MPTYPISGRSFLNDEYRNDNAAAPLVRALARTQNHRYASDLKVSPADPKVYAEAAWPWASYTSELTPVHSFGAGASEWTTGNVAEFLAPDPRGPASQIKVYVNIDRSAVGAVSGTVTVTNLTTVETVSMSVNEPLLTNWWLEAFVRASTGDVLRVTASWSSGTSFRVAGLSAHWAPGSVYRSGATFNSQWSALSQSFHASDAPLCTYALRWLARTSNTTLYERPGMVAASWLYNPAAGTGAGYSTVSTVVGRYMVFIGGQCPGLTVRVRYRSSGACAVDVALSGGGSGTINIPGAGYGVASATIPLTPSGGWYRSLTLTVTGAPAYCDIQHVLVYENHSTAASLSLPAGETVPASFDPNLDERIASGRAIRADDLARLVANEVWLWAYRRDRILVNDCRFSYPEHISPGLFSAFGGVVQRFALHSIHTSKRNAGDAFGEMRIRAGWHQGALVTAPATWEEYRFQIGEVASGDYPGAPELGNSTQHPDAPNASWDSFGVETYQHRRGSAIAGETTYEFETHMRNGIEDTSARPTWVTIEELPINSPALTYP